MQREYLFEVIILFFVACFVLNFCGDTIYCTQFSEVLIRINCDIIYNSGILVMNGYVSSFCIVSFRPER